MIRLTLFPRPGAFIAVFGLLCFGSGSLLASPNIVLILTDDQGWSQLSESMDSRWPEAKSDYLETPNLARMIEQGIRFTSGYAPAPLCTPTRRSILCGTSAARSGTEFASPWVPADHLTIPKALKAVDPDYRCAHFGKWGERMISTPEECGYEASCGETGNVTGGMPNSLIGPNANHGNSPPHFVDNEDPKKTNTVTTRTIDFMREQHEAGRPFFVQASYYAVHLSVVAREKTIDKYATKGTPDRGYSAAWAAMLEDLDQGVGRILDAIEEMEIGGETYVFFTADNGGRGTVPGGDPESTPPNAPLTGAKHSLEEGGIRVPFIAIGPGIAAGTECHTPVVGYDFLPTFRDLAGGEGGPPPGVDGVSFAALLTDPQAPLARPDGAIFFHRPRRLESAARMGDHKLKVEWSRQGEIRTRNLFRVNPDPREEGRNAIDDYPEVAAALEAKLLAHLEAVNAEPVADSPPKKKRKAPSKAEEKR